MSLELRNCFPSASVRPMLLILANSYQITSILHMVLSTVTVGGFLEEKNFWPGGHPKWSYILLESIFDADFEFWICLAPFNIWAQRGGQMGVIQNEFIQTWSSKAFLMWILNFEFVWPNFNFCFWPEEGVKVGVLQNESLQTWWCYISSDSLLFWLWPCFVSELQQQCLKLKLSMVRWAHWQFYINDLNFQKYSCIIAQNIPRIRFGG